MRREGYTTAGRQMMLEYLQNNQDKVVTASDVCNYLKEQNCKVDKTTVYRYLDKLKKEGRLLGHADEKGNGTSYQYVEQGKNCHEHLHLQCTKCGRVVHLDCGFMHTIEEHMKKDHGFALQCDRSIMYGLCEKCQEEEKHG